MVAFPRRCQTALSSSKLAFGLPPIASGTTFPSPTLAGLPSFGLQGASETSAQSVIVLVVSCLPARCVNNEKLLIRIPRVAKRSFQMQLLDRASVCRFFGGDEKPIDPSTLYRGIRQGRYPRPVKVGPGASRWLRDECEAALQAMV